VGGPAYIELPPNEGRRVVLPLDDARSSDVAQSRADTDRSRLRTHRPWRCMPKT